MISMYLDPGFGGMLVQGIVLIVAVGGGILYAFKRKIRGLFKKDGNKPKIEKADTHNDLEDAIEVLDERS